MHLITCVFFYDPRVSLRLVGISSFLRGRLKRLSDDPQLVDLLGVEAAPLRRGYHVFQRITSDLSLAKRSTDRREEAGRWAGKIVARRGTPPFRFVSTALVEATARPSLRRLSNNPAWCRPESSLGRVRGELAAGRRDDVHVEPSTNPGAWRTAPIRVCESRERGTRREEMGGGRESEITAASVGKEKNEAGARAARLARGLVLCVSVETPRRGAFLIQEILNHPAPCEAISPGRNSPTPWVDQSSD